MTKGRVTSCDSNATKDGVTIWLMEKVSDQGAIAKIGVLGNKGLTDDTGIEMPVDNTMGREVIIPMTTSKGYRHGSKGWNID